MPRLPRRSARDERAATASRAKKASAPTSASDFKAIASDSRNPPSAERPSETDRREASRAAKNAANASVIQKMK